jgi:hypothetical protein
MRRLGSILMIGGLVLGAGVGVAIIGGFHFASLPWIVSVGLAKLTLLASAGLMGAGAVCHRLASRDEQRQALPQPKDVDRTKLR